MYARRRLNHRSGRPRKRPFVTSGLHIKYHISYWVSFFTISQEKLIGGVKSRGADQKVCFGTSTIEKHHIFDLKERSKTTLRHTPRPSKAVAVPNRSPLRCLSEEMTTALVLKAFLAFPHGHTSRVHHVRGPLRPKI